MKDSLYLFSPMKIVPFEYRYSIILCLINASKKLRFVAKSSFLSGKVAARFQLLNIFDKAVQAYVSAEPPAYNFN